MFGCKLIVREFHVCESDSETRNALAEQVLRRVIEEDLGEPIQITPPDGSSYGFGELSLGKQLLNLIILCLQCLNKSLKNVEFIF